jgi:alpha-glucosidase
VSELPWWQTGVIYQIYPRSFADTNSDGVGDLAGIEAHLDYVAGLGVDAIWLSPIFPSPMADFGYDIADYTDVAPVFGTLGDLDRLVSAAHGRGLKVLLDLVPNHTSDEHPWFVESRRGRDDSKRDWYLWRDPAPDGGPPNNWVSFFGGSAWEWDAASGQYYLHLFHRKQPDLNWRNPAVRAAIYGVMRFWFDRGIDGFRLDAFWLLFKDPNFPDNAPPPPLAEGEHPVGRYDRPAYEDRPEMQDVVREMRAVADEYAGRVLVGELYLPLARLVRYYGHELDGLHLPFNFGLVTMARWDAASIRRLIERYEAALPPGAWPNWVLGNHDMPRIATRAALPRRAGAGTGTEPVVGTEPLVGTAPVVDTEPVAAVTQPRDGRQAAGVSEREDASERTGEDDSGARLAQMLLLTLRGTPTCYYGDELGVPNGDIPPERVVDPQAAAGMTRDVARTPMPWDDGPNAGFCPPGVEPWLPVSMPPDGSAARQDGDPRSPLALTRQLLGLRRQLGALNAGTIELLDPGEADVVAYVRRRGASSAVVALNFGRRDLRLDLSAAGRHGRVQCTTAMDRDGAVDLDRLALRAREGVLVTLD